ncbi:MAG: DUF4252 domain-containing protein [Bacteroidota bacterium]
MQFRSLITGSFAALFLLTAFSLNAQSSANAIDRYFQQYLDDDRFSVVYIAPRVFQLLDRLSLGEAEVDDMDAELVRDLASDIRGLRILSTSDGARSFYEEAIAKIDTDTYELLMTVRQGRRNNVEFMIREEEEGVISELLLIAGGDESFTLMSFVGNINLNTIMRLGDEIENSH